jgi:hypothetical protein
MIAKGKVDIITIKDSRTKVLAWCIVSTTK